MKETTVMGSFIQDLQVHKSYEFVETRNRNKDQKIIKMPLCIAQEVKNQNAELFHVKSRLISEEAKNQNANL